LSELKTDLSEFIAENFGANATYVETLLGRWRTDPALVDESWRTYFEELLGESTGAKTPNSPPSYTGASSTSEFTAAVIKNLE